MKRTTKKQAILEIARRDSRPVFAQEDILKIRAELLRAHGDAATTSPAYVAKVLAQAGFSVQYEDSFEKISTDDALEKELHEILKFDSLTGAETSLKKIDERVHRFRVDDNQSALDRCRAAVIRAKRRAQALAANPRVQAAKRQEKREIANWCRIWLETPDLFFDWLEIRKASRDFQDKFLDSPEK